MLPEITIAVVALAVIIVLVWLLRGQTFNLSFDWLWGGDRREPPVVLSEPDPVPAEVPDTSNEKAMECEIRYLKNMVRFVGAMAMRENAINAQYRELYPGFSVMSPHVQRLSHEYNFLKNQLREDDNQWTYFKNYFTKLSGIPSASSAVHYDLML